MIPTIDIDRLSPTSRKVFLALPGTETQIADKVGLHSYTVRLALWYLEELGLCEGKVRGTYTRVESPTESTTTDHVLQGEVA
jgi:hypothetical protein